MDRLLSVRDIQNRYQCNPATARKYIREMEHMEKPLMVPEGSLQRWERSRMYPPAADIRRAMK